MGKKWVIRVSAFQESAVAQENQSGEGGRRMVCVPVVRPSVEREGEGRWIALSPPDFLRLQARDADGLLFFR